MGSDKIIEDFLEKNPIDPTLLDEHIIKLARRSKAAGPITRAIIKELGKIDCSLIESVLVVSHATRQVIAGYIGSTEREKVIEQIMGDADERALAIFDRLYREKGTSREVVIEMLTDLLAYENVLAAVESAFEKLQ